MEVVDKSQRLLLYQQEEDNENIHLSAESESGIKTVAVEHKGLSDYLHRTDIIGCDINSDLDVYTIWDNGNVCVFVYTHGGNNDNGLYILCV